VAIPVTATTTVNAIATAPNFASSAMATSVITIQGTATASVNFGSGFTAAGMQVNGSAVLNGTALQLTDNNPAGYEAGSAYWTTPVNVQSFTSNFTFQLTNASADGFTFVLQNNGLTSVGAAGGGLGFAGVPASVAVKFDLYNNAGEGNNSTGLFTDGYAPTLPAITLAGVACSTAAPCSNITIPATVPNLHSGDIFQVNMVYNGTTLSMTITDTTTAAAFTTSWAVNIPAAVGGNTAYVGFTGGDGGGTALQDILTWTYTP